MHSLLPTHNNSAASLSQNTNLKCLKEQQLTVTPIAGRLTTLGVFSSRNTKTRATTPVPRPTHRVPGKI